jgi:hypothetical protein
MQPGTPLGPTESSPCWRSAAPLSRGPASRGDRFYSWHRRGKEIPSPPSRLAARGVVARCASGIPLSLPASTSPCGIGPC